ncbi:YebG family protein [Desulfobacter latus]|uniref:YebG family protein n=1 Tax=Desulfobacter latus TaxID=2292 RepID=A0A850T1X4_9BACT|nr:YebG family protein [Desulfobacter latus]NWH05713.1 YebG family protein [Desulfobacter latus]
MPVIVKYIVVRDGDEKMTFATKKEADAYDKMLDIADNLFDFLQNSDIVLDEARKEEISLLLAEKRDEVMPILRGITPKSQNERKKSAASSETDKTRGKAVAKQTASERTKTSEIHTDPEAKPASKSAGKFTPRTKGTSSKKSGPAESTTPRLKTEGLEKAPKLTSLSASNTTLDRK